MFKSNLKPRSKAIQKPKYPGYSRLKGLMREYGITVVGMSKVIGRATSTVSKANNGHNLYDSMDMVNIQKLINSKAEPMGKKYTIDEIFYS